MTEICYSTRHIIRFVTSALLFTLLANAASADTPVGCTKISEFLEAIEEYKEPLSVPKNVELDVSLRMKLVNGKMDRYIIPGLFELTRVGAANEELFSGNRPPVNLRVRAQGHSAALTLFNVTAVGDFGGDVERPCLEDKAKYCFGEGWSFVGPDATVSFDFEGAKMAERSPSISVFGTTTCKVGEQMYYEDYDPKQAVLRMKELLKGPRIP